MFTWHLIQACISVLCLEHVLCMFCIVHVALFLCLIVTCNRDHADTWIWFKKEICDEFSLVWQGLVCSSSLLCLSGLCYLFCNFSVCVFMWERQNTLVCGSYLSSWCSVEMCMWSQLFLWDKKLDLHQPRPYLNPHPITPALWTTSLRKTQLFWDLGCLCMSEVWHFKHKKIRGQILF